MTDVLMEKIHVKRQRHIQREDVVKTYKNIIHKPRNASGYWELGEWAWDRFSQRSQPCDSQISDFQPPEQ